MTKEGVFMDNGYTQRIQDSLQKNEQIGIVVGKNPTIDDMAAALALYLGLKAAQKNVSIASPTEPIVEISSLVGINKVRTSLDAEGGDLIVAFPYKDREIEKVSYSLENGYLNIIVKAGENGLSFTEKDVQYKRTGGLPTLLFIVGTPRLSDLGGLFNPDALKDTTVVNIDNKADNQGFGDIVVVSPRFSSVSELMANLLEDLALPIDVDIAQNLLLGISFATNNFQDFKTSVTAFEMTAMLMKKGATRVKDNRVRHDASSTGSLQQHQQDPFVSRKNDQRDQFFTEHRQNNPQKPKFDVNTRINDYLTKTQQPRPANPQRQQGGQQPYQQHQQQQHGQQQSQQTPKTNVGQDQKDEEEAPSDWLTPKVYKSSTLV